MTETILNAVFILITLAGILVVTQNHQLKKQNDTLRMMLNTEKEFLWACYHQVDEIMICSAENNCERQTRACITKKHGKYFIGKG